MTADTLETFEKTVQTTNAWLEEIMEEIGPDRHLAWRALGAVLHTVRDRLPLAVAAHLGAQLPLLVRGMYYAEFSPGRTHVPCANAEAFLSLVSEKLQGGRPVDVADAVSAVFDLLSRQITEGQIEKVKEALPRSIRSLWVPLIDRERRKELHRAREAPRLDRK